MASLNIKRLVSLPAELEASTIYITKSATAGLVDLTFVGTDVADVRSAIGVSQVQSVVNTAIENLTAEQIPDLPGTKIVSALTVDTSGNAATATLAANATEAAAALKLKTAVNINGVAFDGSADITVSAVDTVTPRLEAAAVGTSVAPLVDGKVPVGYLPLALDNIDTFPSEADFPETGKPDTIYIAEDVNAMFRWTGTEYILIPSGGGISDTALKLATPRNIGLSGDVTGVAAFDGSADATIVASLADLNDGGEQEAVVTIDTKGRVVSSRALTDSEIPDLPGSKIISALSVDTSGNAATATALAAAVNVTLEGAVAGTASFDGSGDVVIATTLTTTGATAVGATKVTVVDGLVTATAALVEADIPDLAGSKIISALTVDTSGNAATATRAMSAAEADSLAIVAEW